MASDPLFKLPAPDPLMLVAFRWADYDVPFWARDNSRPGRWHRLGDAPTQYWSLDPQAAWAELIRHEYLTSEEEADLVRMPFWTCRIEAGFLVDLRVQTNREAYGITEKELTSDDWGACQVVRQQLDAVRATGVISPSSVMPECANLTLFGPKRAIAWARSPALASTVPAAQVALGRPPVGLVEDVLARGGPPQSQLF